MWRVGGIDGPMDALGDDDEHEDLSTQTTNKGSEFSSLLPNNQLQKLHNQLLLRGHNIIIARWCAAFY
jgi:hypothetical protein